MLRIVLFLTLLFQFNQMAVQDVPVGLPITANFNARSGGVVIPAQMTCVNVNGLGATNPLADIVTGGVTCARVSANQLQGCPSVYTSCSWSNILGILQLVAGAGFTSVIVNVVGTSPDLGSQGCSPPSSAANWATAIQSMIAAIQADSTNGVSSLHLTLELGNEYDLGIVNGTYPNTFWCPPTGHTVLGDYNTLIHTAGPQIAAAFPSLPILIGVLGSPVANGAAWINTSTGILSSSGWATPPSQISVSYHAYLGDAANWAAQNAQDMGSSGTAHLLSTMQGYAGSVPVQVTETNTGSAFTGAFCCRNTPTYAPLWTSNMVISYLNSATIPADVSYYADQGNSSATDLFCVEGLLDANMDCNSSSFQRYPQWYALNLFQNSLNLNAGGNTATSVSPAISATGVSCAAFYTSSGGDVIVCTNPTTLSYGQSTFTFTGAGTLTGNATAYTMYNPTGSATTPTVNSTAIPFRHSGTTYAVTVGMPALSTVAIKIT